MRLFAVIIAFFGAVALGQSSTTSAPVTDPSQIAQAVADALRKLDGAAQARYASVLWNYGSHLTCEQLSKSLRGGSC